MKIKSKLIAGGLMSVVACGLVGSITGTFAWYQYSNRSTVSMKGASVGCTENLEYKIGSNAWSAANLKWDDIAGATNSAAAKLTPVSNGENDGDDPLGTVWYGNPTSASTTMPIYENDVENGPRDDANGGYYQFTFSARYAVNEGGNDSYPDAKLYVSDIAHAVVSGTKDVSFALRMHVQFGTGNSAQCFLVNPYNENSVTTTCSTAIEARNYDWTNNAEQTLIVPSAADAQVAATVVTKAHSTVVSTFNNDGTLNVKGIEVPVSGDSGIAITVTFWLEGFAESTQGSASTDWWTGSTTIGQELQFGFELTGIKD